MIDSIEYEDENMNYLHDQKIKGIMKTMKMIKIIQSLEFIRSSLNSLDVAAEFECARGLSLLMFMTMMMMMVIMFVMVMMINITIKCM